MREWLMAALFFVMVGTAGCKPAEATLPPLPTMTITPSPVPSATTIWFPPTATYTPLPTTTQSSISTLESNPQYGPLIFQDDFLQPELWTTGKMSAGIIAFGEAEISLGVSQPEGYLYSLRKDTDLGDFYLELTAKPSICRQDDEYGILFRVSSELDFFRFGLNCAGEARLDRLLNGIASSPQAPIQNGAVRPGSPSTLHLSIWAMGKEMRFYANGELLFKISDPSLPAGGLGLYARTASHDSMSVNFSELRIYQPSR